MNWKIALASIVTPLAATFAAEKQAYYLASGETFENDGDSYSASSMSGTYASGFANRIRGWATSPDGSAITFAATQGNDYFVTDGRMLRTPWANNAYLESYTFQGDSLSFINGELMTKTVGGKSLTVNDLRVAENGLLTFISNAGSGETILEGNLNIAPGGVFKTSLQSSSASAISFSLNSNISGAGTLHLESADNNPSSSRTDFNVNGSLQDFSGRLYFSNGQNNKDAYFFLNSTLGDCPSPDPQGISLVNNGASTTLIPNTTLTIGPNRGITIVGKNVIGNNNNTPVTISSPLTGDAESMLRITGGGIVYLTSASPDFKGKIVVKFNNSRVVLVDDAIALLDQCSAEDDKGKIDYGYSYAYVDADAPDGREPPYNTPERAAKTITQAMSHLAIGGKVYLKAGQTFNLANEDLNQWKPYSSIIGGGNLSTIIQPTSNNPLTLQNGQICSNIVIRGSIASGTAWPNGTVKIINGHLIDSIVEQFTQNAIICTAGKMTGCIVRNSHQNPTVGNAIGGAVTLTANCTSFTLERCVISNVVSAAIYGSGAIATLWEGRTARQSLYLDRCKIINCRGRSAVARMGLNKQSNIYASNTLFAANQSIDCGTSAANSILITRGEFTNCTFADNISSPGKFIFDASNSNEAANEQQNAQMIKLVNTVISGNGDLATYNALYGQITAKHSLFPEALTYSSDNIVGPAVYSGKKNAPYSLKLDTAGSRAGDPSIWTLNDLDITGEKRLFKRGALIAVDMGCYQFPALTGFMILVR